MTDDVRQVFYTAKNADEITFQPFPSVKTALTTIPKTLFFVDWDDTCLPCKYYDREKPQQTCHYPGWRAMEETLICAFDTMAKLGQICIVTNADRGWVERSAQNTLQSFWRAHLQHLPIVSAKATYGSPSTSSMVWKSKAFAALIDEHKPHQCISFGDSHDERKAVKGLSDSVRKKSVKFSVQPSVRAVNYQWRKLVEHLPYICQSTDPLDMQLVIERTFKL